MPTFYVPVRRSTEDGVDTYHVGEAYPLGQVDRVMVRRTLDGYFATITRQQGAPISVGPHAVWGQFKADLDRWLRELQCPEFAPGSEIREPPLRR
jgi:hypothetical protein